MLCFIISLLIDIISSLSFYFETIIDWQEVIKTIQRRLMNLLPAFPSGDILQNFRIILKPGIWCWNHPQNLFIFQWFLRPLCVVCVVLILSRTWVFVTTTKILRGPSPWQPLTLFLWPHLPFSHSSLYSSKPKSAFYGCHSENIM